MFGNPNIKRAVRLEDSEGRTLAPGDHIRMHFGDEIAEGRLTIEETYVVRITKQLKSGACTETLRHWPNERLAELKTVKIPKPAES